MTFVSQSYDLQSTIDKEVILKNNVSKEIRLPFISLVYLHVIWVAPSELIGKNTANQKRIDLQDTMLYMSHSALVASAAKLYIICASSLSIRQKTSTTPKPV